MKWTAKKEKPSKRELFLRDALLDAQRSQQDAYDGLSNVSDPDLIDSYIYALNSANLRYKVILQDYRLLLKQKAAQSLQPGTKAVKHTIQI